MSFNWKKLQNGSDIRGVALKGVPGESVNLTKEVVEKLGVAFYRWLLGKRNKKNLTLAVGMDSRLSGSELKSAFVGGINKCGADIYDCGLASTPAMFMTTVTKPYEVDGAVMLTASHLPFNRNGLKFFTSEGGLEKKDITEILDIAAVIDDLPMDRGKCEPLDFIDLYAQMFVDKIRKEVNAVNYELPLEGMKIIVDAGNGAGGFYADKVLQQLGADVAGSQFLEPDGQFPNHIPNPEDPKAMASICEAVTNTKADLGIIFDTDVDRAAIVDSNGRAINRNELVALSAAIVLDEYPESTIVTDSITSDGLGWFINDFLGGTHHRFKRGYKNVINEGIRLNEAGKPCWLAIETSGHAALKENYFLDDGAYLVTKMVIKMALLRKQGQQLTDLIKDLPVPYDSREFRIKITDPDFKVCGEEVISKLGLFAASQSNWDLVPDNYEGVRVACGKAEEKGWFLLRLSLHDPVIPLNIDSDVDGGIEKIAEKLIEFFNAFQYLDLSAFKNYKK
ncbi:phosphomannomutase/phosphoglucomutase [Marinilabiliaceae bacterium JC017]|nr:phosphomannomutase/phosphoglucomutase [Marinilabiliaceae bacterium JC017]